MKEKLHASLEAALAPVKSDGEVGQGTFIRTVTEWLKGIAREQIDTEEERDNIIAVVLTAADQYVAPRFPPALWKFVRNSVDKFLDDALDQLPELLKTEPILP